ncbi:hypothetical protein Ddye_028515 [Dipteronia dyeriana]|uniref:R13L1/DRL21-like LRR repeat region domain-containing protein n=1 Tax=Dipteronia dyeriana TaxID=168575 RepID=A0AAD9WKW3_9ROSI|nr:hypothetical protein Ddye_028515 [Dipteronia dyeriana]
MARRFPSFKSLKIEDFPSLQRFSREDGRELLPCLTSLDITNCRKLTLPHLPSVEKLKCRKFTSLTEGLQHLSCLETLIFIDCPELVTLPDGMKYLASLHHLELSGHDFEIASKLEVLPEALRFVPALKSLSIYYYSNLASLPHWLGDLTSLQTLTVIRCPKLSSLPASIQGLTMLQKLHIRGCPELAKRCEKEKGEDWYKIAHIPIVEVSIPFSSCFVVLSFNTFVLITDIIFGSTADIQNHLVMPHDGNAGAGSQWPPVATTEPAGEDTRRTLRQRHKTSSPATMKAVESRATQNNPKQPKQPLRKQRNQQENIGRLRLTVDGDGTDDDTGQAATNCGDGTRDDTGRAGNLHEVERAAVRRGAAAAGRSHGSVYWAPSLVCFGPLIWFVLGL